MTTQQLTLALVNNNTLSQPIHLDGAAPFRTRAVLGGRYLLAQGEKGTGPQTLAAKRIGNNLELSLPDEAHPRLIIEDFYLHDGEVGGLAEDGSYHPYINATEHDDREASELTDDEGAFLIMSPDAGNLGTLALADGAGLNFLKAAGAFAALLALGGIIYTFHHHHSGEDAPLPVPVIVNASTEESTLLSGESTNNPTPAITGNGGTPGNMITLYDNGVLIGSTVVDESGNWTFTPPELAHGMHTFTATESNGSDKVSALSALFELNIDLLPPDVTLDSVSDTVEGGVVGAISHDGTGLTNDTQPRLSGTTEAGSLVTIYDGETVIGNVQADALTGVWTWQYEGANAFTEGTHTLSVTATDAVGNVSAPTESVIITVDTIIAQPTLDSVSDAVAGGIVGPISDDGTGLTNDAQPRLSGTAEAGSLVTIYDGATAIGSVKADAVTGDWSWQYAGSEQFAEGEHVLTVRAVDPAGNTSTLSDSFTITVDSQAVQPTLDTVTDAVAGGVVGAISHDGIGLTNDTQPRLSGKAEAGSLVTLYDGSTVIGSVVADATSGVWSWQYAGSEQFAEGTHVLTVRAVDIAGNSSVLSDSFTITVDTLVSQPTLDTVIDAVVGGVVGPISHDGIGLTNDAQPQLNGIAEAGSLVTIYDGATAIGSVVADAATGSWSWQYAGSEQFAEGAHVLTVRAVDPAGNTSLVSDSFTITVNTQTAKPTLDTVTDAVAGGVVGAISHDGTGLTNDAQPRLSGTAEAGSLVTIYDGATAIGSVMADAASGAWSWQYASNEQFDEGQHVLTVQALDPAGNTSPASDNFTITVDTQISQPTLDTVTDAVAGGIVGALNNDGTGLTNDARPVIGGIADAGSLVTLYRGATAIGSVVADTTTGAWSWQYSGSEKFADGQHLLTVKAVDAAGNISAPSDSFTITVDTTPPGGATITAGIDHVGALSETILPNRVTDDTAPEFYGTADPLAWVYLYDNGQLLGSFQANSLGEWRWILPELTPGQHNLSISTSDAAGNMTATPDVYPFQVGDVWDFNDGTYQGWTIVGTHAVPGSTFTRQTADGGSQLEFITPVTSASYAGDVMRTEIEVEAGKAYDFSFILSRITSYQLINPAQLALTVDGVPVSSYYTVTDTPQKVEGSWVATTTGKITLAIHNLVASGQGNDFWIDDIAIAPHELAGAVMPSVSGFMAPEDIMAYSEEQPVTAPADAIQPLDLSLTDALVNEDPSLFTAPANDESTDNQGNDPIVSLLDIHPEAMAGEHWAAESTLADKAGLEPTIIAPAGNDNAALMDIIRDDHSM